jgi:putative hydrolase of the HAD superfamily
MAQPRFTPTRAGSNHAREQTSKLGWPDQALRQWKWRLPQEQTFFMALRAVIFDYGMVLSAPADPAAHQQLVHIFGAPAETFEKQYWVHRLAYDEGQLDGPSYWKLCAAESGVRLTEPQIHELIETDIRMWSSLNQPMVDWALQVKDSGFRVGILSNIGEELAASLIARPWVNRFDHNTWSCHLRLAKPDPAIYHKAVEGLGVKPEEALFLDDRQENVLAAQSVGLHAAIFRDIEKLAADLQSLSFASLLPPLPVEEAA